MFNPMQGRDIRDILTGVVLIAFGIFVATYAMLTLEIGDLQRMGPGMFPAGLGMLLCVFGFAILIPAFFREAALPAIDLRSVIAVLGAIAGFAILFDYFGLIVAVLGLTLISLWGSGRVALPKALLLAASLLMLAFLIFRAGLGMPLPLYNWPF